MPRRQQLRPTRRPATAATTATAAAARRWRTRRRSRRMPWPGPRRPRRPRRPTAPAPSPAAAAEAPATRRRWGPQAGRFARRVALPNATGSWMMGARPRARCIAPRSGVGVGGVDRCRRLWEDPLECPGLCAVHCERVENRLLGRPAP